MKSDLQRNTHQTYKIDNCIQKKEQIKEKSVYFTFNFKNSLYL